MKFTLSWLKEHLKTDASLDDIAYALTDLGLEVEGIENPLDKLEDFTIGYVSNAEDYESLANSIIDFSKLNSIKKNELGKNARDYYEKEFERSRLLTRLIDIFEK